MKEVKIKIVSERGHEELVLPSVEAVEEIRKQSQENGKWVYIDGEYKSADVLTERDLEEARSIILTNSLEGG